MTGKFARGRARFGWAALAALSSLLAGCGAPAPREIRLGINFWPTDEFFHLAAEKGIFEEDGLRVRLVEFSSLNDSRRAFERGQIDAVTATLSEAIVAAAEIGEPPAIFGVQDYSDGGDMILAKAPSASMADLKGKRVAVELGTVNMYVLARALELAAMTEGDVIQVPMDQMSMPAAFEKGEIDAAVCYPPASAAILKMEGAVRVFDSSRIPGEVVDILMARAEDVEKRPEDYAKLLRGYERAREMLEARPEESLRIMADREGVTPEDFRLSLETGLTLVPLSGQAEFLAPGGKLEGALTRNQAILRAAGKIGREFPPAAFLAPAPAAASGGD